LDELARPPGPTSWRSRAQAWIDWFGVARLVTSAVAVVVVGAGVVWLVRSPPPPTEASLPMTTADHSTAPGSTTGDTVAAAEPPTPPVVLVHVAGAVVEPGVYELTPDARVRDAVVAAGGPTTDADRDALNLAAPVVDGTRVYVPEIGEELPPDALAPGGSDAPRGPIDVNRATVEQLDELPGVGPATAAAIVTERERNGPFVTVDDLDRVPGIGPAKLAALRDLVTT
jgi:competence protein ComEA